MSVEATVRRSVPEGPPARNVGLGLDFGTTNSALAMCSQEGGARVFAFAGPGGAPTRAFRSVLFAGREDRRAPVEFCAGPLAIERYVELDEDRRLLQSLKSFLASRLFNATSLFGRHTTLDELIGRIVRGLREEVEATHGALAGPVVVGRPVRFAKARTDEDDGFATERLRKALALGGFEDVRFEFEPVGAAYHYEASLQSDELVLIADFGGGTSDFCLLHVGPGARVERGEDGGILGTEGVAIAGDAFDARIVRNAVAPELGYGSTYTPFMGKPVGIPNSIYRDLERWHHLSFLKSRETLGFLGDVLRGAAQPEKIAALLHIVENDLGFTLYQAVEAAKRGLSTRSEVTLRFHDPPASLEAVVTRNDFEAWIRPDVTAIAACVDRLLEKTGTPGGRVDRVFLTGGSSLVPAVRAIFDERFGADRVRTGDELTSVASGLALCARDLEAKRS